MTFRELQRPDAEAGLQLPMAPRFHYGWLVAGVTFVVLVTAAGVNSAPTLFIAPLEDGFGWTAATVSGALALQIALFGLTGPFAAASMARYGIRPTVGVALAIIATACLAETQIHTPWQLWLCGATIGLGVGSIALTLGATIANRWFTASRGLVVGVFAAGNATGQLVFLPLFAHIVADHGWRTVLVILAVLCVAIAPLFLFVVRERPADVNLPPYGGTTVEPAPAAVSAPLRRAFTTLREAGRTRIFWVLSGTFFICGASTNGLIGAHLVPACGDHGIPATHAAGLLATMGIFDLFGTTLSGWLSDRYSSRSLLFWYYGLRGVSLIFLPVAFGIGVFGLPIFAMIYGLDWIATLPPTLRLATSAFGRERAPIVFGWIVAAHQIGAGSTALLAGVVRTSLGTYNDAFVAAGLLCMCAAALILTAARAPRLEPAFAAA